MGAWSGEPFGNDTAADFAAELDDERRWAPIKVALKEAVRAPEPMDADLASIAIAAAEVVAHGLGRPTQSDSYTTEVEAFVSRAGKPPRRLVALARQAAAKSMSPGGELAELWAEGGGEEWREANARLIASLAGR